MNTAICLAGTGRQIDYTFENLKEYLIEDIENSDTIVYITKTDDYCKVKSLFESLDNTYTHVVQEQPIDISRFTFRPNWPPSTPNNLELGRQIYLQMIKSRSYLNTLIDRHEKDLCKKYDRVIFSRMDVVYEKPVYDLVKDLELRSDLVWIPSFHNWHYYESGYNDRFVVSNREGAWKYFSLYDHAEEYAGHGHPFRAEATLKYHLGGRKMDVRHFDIRFARYRNGQQHDDFGSLTNTAWVKPYKR
jgi:hypothetical protein|tara:strand:- start:675 stop:1412 length:738 start_codon:yes stop_codon:yes gene_type:complete